MRPPEDVAETAARARLRRIGVIDVGSNSVRLVVFDGMDRSPAYFYNEKVLCGLGAGLLDTGKLNPEGWRKAMAALERFTALASRMHVSGLVAVATAAVRESVDGPLFCDEVARLTGLQLQVASGPEEARLSANGVLLGWPAARGVVCDMGGSSTELAQVSEGGIHACETAPLGPLKLADIPEGDMRTKYIRRQVKALRKAVPGDAHRLFLVGGSWRAIARLDMERSAYPLKVLHGYEPPIPQLLETLDWIPTQKIEDLSALSGTSAARLSLVPLVGPVLAELIRRIEPDRVAVSAYGLREGLLYRQMPEEMRKLDPLIESCLHAEARSARMPGFGMALHDWLAPLYAEAPESEKRLVRAACLLHDVNWRAHPDYRSETCFAFVTRSNLGGLDHSERVFLGMALLNRYKTNVPSGTVAHYEPLIAPKRRTDAVVLGRLMRLGSMLSGSASGVLALTSLSFENGRLILTLRGKARACIGDAVERRLQSLASKLDVPSEIVLEP